MFRSAIKYFLLCLVLNIILVYCTNEELKVQLKHGGFLVGDYMITEKQRQIKAFRGIPYGQPPVGELRFRPPVPFGAWKGEKLAKNDSNMCTQVENGIIDGVEDCLYLNVYVPERNTSESELLSVIIWYHGGGLEFGSGLSSQYGPEYLLDRDIILVSGNYRLGPLGFLSTETLDCPGNFGFKDQLEILKWVQENIASFGGNPNSVTIMGESAGAVSVNLHMISNRSKGLFHKAILHSGTAFNLKVYPPPKGIAAKTATKFASLLKCTDSNGDWKKIINCLRTKSANDIIATMSSLYEWQKFPGLPFPPIIEPEHETAFLTKYFRDIEHSYGNDIPVLTGVNRDEGVLTSISFLKPEVANDFKINFDRLLPIVVHFHHESPRNQEIMTENIKENYFKNGVNFDENNLQNLTDLFSDAHFFHSMDEWMQRRLKSRAKETYIYFLKQKPTQSVTYIFLKNPKIYGVCHVDDLQYLFKAPLLFPQMIQSETDLEIRENMLDLWTTFARTGNPTLNNSKLPNWSPTTEYPYSYYRIGRYEEPIDKPLFEVEHNLLKDRLDFWNDLTRQISNSTSKRQINIYVMIMLIIMSPIFAILFK